ncbi:hypothetical protein QW131_08320 [Roseibium salinum]|nr:hypothetical protein [Roseibium salinum]
MPAQVFRIVVTKNSAGILRQAGRKGIRIDVCLFLILFHVEIGTGSDGAGAQPQVQRSLFLEGEKSKEGAICRPTARGEDLQGNQKRRPDRSSRRGAALTG